MAPPVCPTGGRGLYRDFDNAAAWCIAATRFHEPGRELFITSKVWSAIGSGIKKAVVLLLSLIYIAPLYIAVIATAS